jgi:pimeloyl-ACP methyl ester carboxylesterase
LVHHRAERRAAMAEASFPPTGQLISVGNTTVHAHVEGDGPDLVLIHGASGNTRDFTFGLVDQLKGRFRVIVLDRPGLGWTEGLGAAGLDPMVQADLLRAAAAQIGVTRPVVLGHSYGGAVALAWALGDRVDTAALVLVSAASMPWPDELDLWYKIMASRIGGATIIPLISAFAGKTQAEKAIESIFAPQAAPVGYAEYVGAGLTLRRETFRANARQVNTLKPHVTAYAARYPELALPVEVIHGTADTIVPIDIHSEPLARLIPDAQLTRLEGIGHMPHHSAPEAVIAAIDRAAARARLR